MLNPLNWFKPKLSNKQPDRNPRPGAFRIKLRQVPRGGTLEVRESEFLDAMRGEEVTVADYQMMKMIFDGYVEWLDGRKVKVI